MGLTHKGLFPLISSVCVRVCEYDWLKLQLLWLCFTHGSDPQGHLRFNTALSHLKMKNGTSALFRTHTHYSKTPSVSGVWTWMINVCQQLWTKNNSIYYVWVLMSTIILNGIFIFEKQENTITNISWSRFSVLAVGHFHGGGLWPQRSWVLMNRFSRMSPLIHSFFLRSWRASEALLLLLLKNWPELS